MKSVFLLWATPHYGTKKSVTKKKYTRKYFYHKYYNNVNKNYIYVFFLQKYILTLNLKTCRIAKEIAEVLSTAQMEN